MALTNQQKNQHLLWRAGFGPAVEQLGDLTHYSPKEFYKPWSKLLKKRPAYINVADNYLQGLVMGVDAVGQMQKKELSAEEKKQIKQKNKEAVPQPECILAERNGEQRRPAQGENGVLLAWAFCVPQPECFLPAGFTGCDPPACAGQFRYIIKRGFQISGHAEFF